MTDVRPAHVLVVDDDRSMRSLARQSLEVAGFSVTEARDGHEALALLEAPGSPAVDLVLLDVDMPGLDGFQVCKQIRSQLRLRDLPVLMMTGLNDLESIDRAYEAGATDFVLKPPNWAILAHRVRYMVRSSRVTVELRWNKERLVHTQRIANLGWWDWDLAGSRVTGSEQFHKIFGLEPDASGHSWEDFLRCIHPEDRDLLRCRLDDVVQQRGSLDLDHRVCRVDGTVRIVHQQAQIADGESANGIRVVGAVQDVTERKEIEERIRHLAYFDELTGLPNRQLFQDRLELAVEAARRHQRHAALLFLDLDRFKRINDTLGHGAGDEILRKSGERISQCVRQTDCVSRPRCGDADFLVARLGGDEFIILLSEIERVEDAAVVARRIIEALSRPFLAGGHEVVVSASVGIAIHPLDGKDAETLLKNADVAMYHAKDQGRDNYQFYNEAMNARALERLMLEGDLRRALDRGEFVLHYQPQVDLRSGKVVGAEALVRWQHPELGLMAPAGFIGLAEETGLINALGRWVLRAACAQGREWERLGGSDLRIAVNVSRNQFRETGFVETIAEILEETGLPVGRLELEITETVLMEDDEDNRRVLEKLKDLGVGLSIDDFGTGYSSLGYLSRLPIDALKVDRSFLAGLPLDSDGKTLTAAIVALGRSLGLRVVAEGVESAEQLSFLWVLGCDEIQGYLVSRPVPPETFVPLLRSRLAEDGSFG